MLKERRPFMVTADEVILAKAGKDRDCFKKVGNRLEAARKKLRSDMAKRNAQARKERDSDCFKKLALHCNAVKKKLSKKDPDYFHDIAVKSATTKKAMKELYQTNPKEYLRQLFEKHKNDKHE